MRIKKKPKKAEVRELKVYLTCTWNPLTIHICRHRHLFLEQERLKALRARRIKEERERIQAYQEYQDRIKRIINPPLTCSSGKNENSKK